MNPKRNKSRWIRSDEQGGNKKRALSATVAMPTKQSLKFSLRNVLTPSGVVLCPAYLFNLKSEHKKSFVSPNKILVNAPKIVLRYLVHSQCWNSRDSEISIQNYIVSVRIFKNATF